MEKSEELQPKFRTPADAKQLPAVEDVMANIRQDMKDYHRAVKQAPHDPMKLLVAGMVNQKMLDDTAAECERVAEKTGMKAPDAKMLKEIQEWAFKYKKRHPLAKQEQVQKATALHFNLMIVPDESA